MTPKQTAPTQRTLGHSGITVSSICLGTMTWGTQNTEAQAHDQMDLALDRHVTFWDTAELYPIPKSNEVQGRTEDYIGTWFAARGQRDKIVLSSKVVGPMDTAKEAFRGGDNRFDRHHMTAALERSLTRCQTDYLDLYLLHWPERDVQVFGEGGHIFNRQITEDFTAFEETITILEEFHQAGKIRSWGLSNETPWGAMRFIETARRMGVPGPVTIQNAYSLLNRSFELSLAEIAAYEGMGLMAYSTLAMGLLTGKYRHSTPEGSRLSLWDNPRYTATPQMKPALEAYLDLAAEFGLKPIELALSFAEQRPFVTSSIIGATSTKQLADNIAASQVALSPAVVARLDQIQGLYPNPCP